MAYFHQDHGLHFILFSSRKIQLFQNPYVAKNIFKIQLFYRYFNFANFIIYDSVALS